MKKLLLAFLLFALPVRAQTFLDGYFSGIAFSGGGTSDYVNSLWIVQAASTSGGITWVLPSTVGAAGSVLIADGANPSVMTWHALTAGPGINIASSGSGITISARADSTGSFIKNQNTAQAPGEFNVEAGAPAKTANYTQTTVLNDAISSTGSILKNALTLRTSGAWSGAFSQAIGLGFSVTGGTVNNDIVGTSNNWYVRSSGDANFNNITSFGVAVHSLLLGNAPISDMGAGTSGQVPVSGGVSADPLWTSMSMPPVGGGGIILANTTKYFNPNNSGGSAGNVAPLINYRFIVTRACTVAMLGIQLDIPSGIGQNVTATLFKNGVATGLVVTITGGVALTGNNTGTTITCAQWDDLCLQVVSTLTSASTAICWGVDIR